MALLGGKRSPMPKENICLAEEVLVGQKLACKEGFASWRYDTRESMLLKTGVFGLLRLNGDLSIIYI